jgi:signal transduction histidine kinase
MSDVEVEAGGGGGAHILVVDDEPANRRLLEAILRPEGYTLVTAENGRAALPIIAGGGVDLVLLDVMMPELDGIAACRAIREDLQQPFLPVVLVTALNDSSSRARGKEVGADDFITKPVYEEELLARVRTLLRVKGYQDSLEAQRRRARGEARRWRIVSRVAERLATVSESTALPAVLVEALGDDLPILPPVIGSGAQALADGVIAIPIARDGSDDALFVRSADGACFDADDVVLLMSLGVHVANALAHAQLRETREALDVARERFTRLVVHDLKNPLSVVRMNLEHLKIALRGHAEPDEEDALGDALAGAEQMQSMLLDLLDIGLAEDGRLPYLPDWGDLGYIVGNAAEQFRSVIERPPRSGAPPRLVIDVAAGVPALPFDQRLVVRVLQNLLINASRFVGAGGVVEVTVCASDDRAVVTVANSGPAISDDIKRHLFDKYGQSNANQTNANRGLGLYLCRLVAERHGGTMSVHDRAAGGVRFELAIPLAP